MCGEFGEVTVIIGLVINFLAFVSPLLTLRDTLTYSIGEKSPFFIFTNFIPLYTSYQPKITIQSIPIHIQS